MNQIIVKQYDSQITYELIFYKINWLNVIIFGNGSINNFYPDNDKGKKVIFFLLSKRDFKVSLKKFPSR